jgi:hypothetical protein
MTGFEKGTPSSSIDVMAFFLDEDAVYAMEL